MQTKIFTLDVCQERDIGYVVYSAVDNCVMVK